MADTVRIRRSLIDFLSELAENNNREWFQANKSRYHDEVRDPLIRFTEAFAPRLRRISPNFVADPRPVGGSLFRIYRDTRFSKNKAPYKTWAALHFRHVRAKDVHAPGFYLHIAPDNVFMGVGLWHPDSATLGKIRERMVDRPAEWKRALKSKEFAGTFELAGDSLKRPPRGYDADHELIEDLKRKDLIAVANFSEAQLTRVDFLDRFTKTAAASKPFMRFLTRATGQEW